MSRAGRGHPNIALLVRTPQGDTTITGALAGATSPASGALAGIETQTGALAGTTSPATGQLTGDVPYSPIQETFGSYSTASSWAQGSTNGIWYVNFDGGGQVIPVDVSGNRTLQLESVTGLADPGGTETAASLVTSTVATTGDLILRVRMRTVAQLRTGYSPTNTPNAWEVAWLAWNFTEPSTGVRRFYYVALKTNGIELGKVDQSIALPGGQRFLFTDGTAFSVGTWYDVLVQQTGSQIQVWIDGTLRANFTDGPGSLGTPNWGTSGETVMTTGAVGLYHEDARVQFDEVLASGTVAVPTTRQNVWVVSRPRPAGYGRATAAQIIAAPVDDPGVLAGTTPTITGALTGIETAGGALAGVTSPAVAAIPGTVTDAAALAGVTSPASGALTADVADAGVLAGATSPAAGAITGTVTQTGALAGSTPTTSGALTGATVDVAARQTVWLVTRPRPTCYDRTGSVQIVTAAVEVAPATAVLAGSTSPAAGALTADVVDAGALAGATSPASGAIPGAVTQTGALAGSTSPAVGALTSSTVTTGALAGATSPASGALAAGVTDTAALAAATSPASGAIAGTITQTGALAGATSPAVGTLTSSSTNSGVVAGTAPHPATGALTATSYLAVALAGSTSPAAGALAGVVRATGASAGTTPSPAGAMAATITAAAVLAGATSAAYGELNRAPVIFYPLHPGMVVQGGGRYRAGGVTVNRAPVLAGEVVDGGLLLLAGEPT